MNSTYSRQPVWRRCIALAVVLCMLAGDLPAFALDAPAITPQRIAVPESFGRIEASHRAGSRTVVFIQDAHTSFEAQRNIARIIGHAVDELGVSTVYEEGYEGEVPTDRYFGTIKNGEIRERVAWFLMDRLRIGGAEYAHITREKDFKLMGADSLHQHDENVKHYRQTWNRREETLKDLNALRRELDRLAGKFLPDEIKSWLKLRSRWEEERLGLEDYLRRFAALAKPSLENFENRFPLSHLILNGEALGIERLEKKLAAIEHADFFEELEAMEQAFVEARVTSERDVQLLEYLDALVLIRRFHSFEISTREYHEVQKLLEMFDTRRLGQFLIQYTNKPLVLSKRWESNLDQVRGFYETAHRRDDNIARALDRFAGQSGERVTVLVYGGFHRERITEMLRERNLSYHVVTPVIGERSARHEAYYRQLMAVGRHDYEAPLLDLNASRSQTLPFEEVALSRVAESRMLTQLLSWGNVADDYDAVRDPERVLLHKRMEAVTGIRIPAEAKSLKETRPVEKAGSAREELRTDDPEPPAPVATAEAVGPERRISVSYSIKGAKKDEYVLETRKAEEAGADNIHIDIYDGVLSPWSGDFHGLNVLAQVRPHTQLPMSVHVKLAEPAVQVLDDMLDAGFVPGHDRVWIHLESFADPADLRAFLDAAKRRGMKIALTINPHTHLTRLFDLEGQFDGLLDRVAVMTVVPGGDHAFVKDSLERLRAIRQWFDDKELDAGISVDGGIDLNNVGSVVEAGADEIIARTVYLKAPTLRLGIRQIRERRTLQTRRRNFDARIRYKRRMLSALWGDHRVKIEGKKRFGLEDLGLVNRFEIGSARISIYRGDFKDPGVREEGDTYVLGISGSWHDATAVLFRNGEMIGALEEERRTREKHDPSRFPVNAIRELLRQHGLTWNDIDHLAVGWDYNDYVETPGMPVSPGARTFDAIDRRFMDSRGIAADELIRRDVPERNARHYQPEVIEGFLDEMEDSGTSYHRPRVTFAPHHMAHAASTYYGSGFEEPTLVVTIDGYGDQETTSVWFGKDGELEPIDTVEVPNSLGWAYIAMTEYMGFKPGSAEGEVMGLASYGQPTGEDPAENERFARMQEFMKELIKINPEDGSFDVNAEYSYYGPMTSGMRRVTDKMVADLSAIIPPQRNFGDRLDPNDPDHRPYANLAYALQERVEEAIVNYIGHYLRRHPRTRGVKKLALAGGVTYNITANSRLIQAGLVSPSDLYVQPAAGDSGTAMGAAALVSRELYRHEPSFTTRRADYGGEYSDEEIKRALDAMGLVEGQDYEQLSDMDTAVEHVADLIAKNHAVAWFQGRSEVGPRALGQRSILLNISDSESNARANLIKDRQWWRPSAASITIEGAQEHLELIGDAHAPFMNLAFDVKPESQGRIASGLHLVDKSTRPQTVAREDNPLYWQLLTAVGDRTGMPAVVNTSFNQKEPLVETPIEALNTFYYMEGVDVLSIGTFVVKHRDFMPNIPSLNKHTQTRDLLGSAPSPDRISDWDRIFDAARRLNADVPETARQEVVVVLRNHQGEDLELRFPVVKEMFAGPTRQVILDAIGASIYARALDHGGARVFIGASQPDYNLVVHNLLAPVYEKFSRRAEFTNSGSIVEVEVLPETLPEAHPMLEPQLSYTAQVPESDTWAVTFDMGGTNTRVGIMNGENLVWHQSVPTPRESPEALAQLLQGQFQQAVAVMRDTYGTEPSALGMAVPGLVSMPAARTGHIKWLVDLEAGWDIDSEEERRNAYQVLSETLGQLAEEYEISVEALNDVHAFGVAEMTLSETFNDGADRTVMAVGTGVGAVSTTGQSIDFNRQHQVQVSVVDLSADAVGEINRGATGTLSDNLSLTRWEQLEEEAELLNMQDALSQGQGAQYEDAMEIVNNQASYLVNWIAHHQPFMNQTEIILSGGLMSGLLGQTFVAAVNARRAEQYPDLDVHVRLSELDPNLGGLIGAGLFAMGVERQELRADDLLEEDLADEEVTDESLSLRARLSDEVQGFMRLLHARQVEYDANRVGDLDRRITAQRRSIEFLIDMASAAQKQRLQATVVGELDTLENMARHHRLNMTAESGRMAELYRALHDADADSDWWQDLPSFRSEFSGLSMSQRSYARVIRESGRRDAFYEIFQRVYKAQYGRMRAVAAEFGMDNVNTFKKMLGQLDIHPSAINLERGDLLAGVEMTQREAIAFVRVRQWNLTRAVFQLLREESLSTGDFLEALDLVDAFKARVKLLYTERGGRVRNLHDDFGLSRDEFRALRNRFGIRYADFEEDVEDGFLLSQYGIRPYFIRNLLRTSGWRIPALISDLREHFPEIPAIRDHDFFLRGLGLRGAFQARVAELTAIHHGDLTAVAADFGLKVETFRKLMKAMAPVEPVETTEQAVAWLENHNWNIPRLVRHIQSQGQSAVFDPSKRNYLSVLKHFDLGRALSAKAAERYRANYGHLEATAQDFGFTGADTGPFRSILTHFGVDLSAVELKAGDLLGSMEMSRDELIDKLHSDENGGLNWNLRKLRAWVIGNSGASAGISYYDLLTGLDLLGDFIKEYKRLWGLYYWNQHKVAHRFGFKRYNNIDSLVRKIGIDHTTIRKADDFLPLLGFSDRQELYDLLDLYGWDLPGFLEAHAGQLPSKQFGYLELINKFKIRGRFRQKILEVYRGQGGVLNATRDVLNLDDITFRKIASDLGIDFAKVRVPAGSLLPTVFPETESRHDRELAAHRLVESLDWALPRLKAELARMHRFAQHKGFSYARLLKGLGMLEAFKAEVQRRRRLPAYRENPRALGESFGFGYSAAKESIEKVLADVGARHELRPNADALGQQQLFEAGQVARNRQGSDEAVLDQKRQGRFELRSLPDGVNRDALSIEFNQLLHGVQDAESMAELAEMEKRVTQHPRAGGVKIKPVAYDGEAEAKTIALDLRKGQVLFRRDLVFDTGIEQKIPVLWYYSSVIDGGTRVQLIPLNKPLRDQFGGIGWLAQPDAETFYNGITRGEIIIFKQLRPKQKPREELRAFDFSTSEPVAYPDTTRTEVEQILREEWKFAVVSFLNMAYVLPERIQPAPWNFHKTRAQRPARILTEEKEWPVLQLTYPFNTLPRLVGENPGDNNDGIYLGFVEGVRHPVAIKLMKGEAREEPWHQETEAVKAQVMAAQGIVSDVYGLIRLADGRWGFAMEVATLHDYNLFGRRATEPDLKRIIDRANEAGLSAPSWAGTPEGEVIAYDADNSHSQRREDAYRAFLDRSRAVDNIHLFVPGASEEEQIALLEREWQDWLSDDVVMRFSRYGDGSLVNTPDYMEVLFFERNPDGSPGTPIMRENAQGRTTQAGMRIARSAKTPLTINTLALMGGTPSHQVRGRDMLRGMLWWLQKRGFENVIFRVVENKGMPLEALYRSWENEGRIREGAAEKMGFQSGRQFFRLHLPSMHLEPRAETRGPREELRTDTDVSVQQELSEAGRFELRLTSDESGTVLPTAEDSRREELRASDEEVAAGVEAHLREFFRLAPEEYFEVDLMASIHDQEIDRETLRLYGYDEGRSIRVVVPRTREGDSAQPTETTGPLLVLDESALESPDGGRVEVLAKTLGKFTDKMFQVNSSAASVRRESLLRREIALLLLSSSSPIKYWVSDAIRPGSSSHRSYEAIAAKDKRLSVMKLAWDGRRDFFIVRKTPPKVNYAFRKDAPPERDLAVEDQALLDTVEILLRKLEPVLSSVDEPEIESILRHLQSHEYSKALQRLAVVQAESFEQPDYDAREDIFTFIVDDILRAWSRVERLPVISAESDWRAEFAAPDHELYMEIGYGSGRGFRTLAARYPDINWLGVEPNIGRFLRMISALKETPLSNVRIIYGRDHATFEKNRTGQKVDLLYSIGPYPELNYFFQGPDERIQRAMSFLADGAPLVVYPGLSPGQETYWQERLPRVFAGASFHVELGAEPYKVDFQRLLAPETGPWLNDRGDVIGQPALIFNPRAELRTATDVSAQQKLSEAGQVARNRQRSGEAVLDQKYQGRFELRAVDRDVKRWIEGDRHTVSVSAEDGQVFEFKYERDERIDHRHRIDVYSGNQKIGFIHFSVTHNPQTGITSGAVDEGFSPHNRTANAYSTQRAGVFVDDDYRRRDIAQALMGLAERMTLYSGGTRFYAIGVGWGNFKDFYEKLGYRDAELAPFYDLHQTVVKDLGADTLSEIAIKRPARAELRSENIRAGVEAHLRKFFNIRPDTFFEVELAENLVDPEMDLETIRLYGYEQGRPIRVVLPRIRQGDPASPREKVGPLLVLNEEAIEATGGRQVPVLAQVHGELDEGVFNVTASAAMERESLVRRAIALVLLSDSASLINRWVSDLLRYRSRSYYSYASIQSHDRRLRVTRAENEDRSAYFILTKAPERPDRVVEKGRDELRADADWANPIQDMLTQGIEFFPRRFSDQGHVFKGIQTGLRRMLVNGTYDLYDDGNLMAARQEELKIRYVSHQLIDALGGAGYLQRNQQDAAILVMTSEYFNRQLELGRAAIEAFDKATYNYPLLTESLRLEDIEFILVDPRTKQYFDRLIADETAGAEDVSLRQALLDLVADGSYAKVLPFYTRPDISSFARERLSEQYGIEEATIVESSRFPSVEDDVSPLAELRSTSGEPGAVLPVVEEVRRETLRAADQPEKEVVTVAGMDIESALTGGLDHDVVFTLRGQDLEGLESEEWKRLLALKALNDRFLHIYIETDLRQAVPDRALELQQHFRNVRIDQWNTSLGAEVPVIYFGDPNHGDLNRILSERLREKMTDRFVLRAGAFGVGLLYAVNGSELQGLAEVGGYLSDVSGRWSSEVMVILSKNYEVFSRSA